MILGCAANALIAEVLFTTVVLVAVTVIIFIIKVVIIKVVITCSTVARHAAAHILSTNWHQNVITTIFIVILNQLE